VKKISLSPERQYLLDLVREVRCGRIEQVEVHEGEPRLTPLTRVYRESQFGGSTNHDTLPTDNATERQKIDDLLTFLDSIGDGNTVNIEVRDGLPFRAQIELIPRGSPHGYVLQAASTEARIRSLPAEPTHGKSLPTIEPFPTPEGAVWRDVRIRFVDGHIVSIQVLGKRGVRNYTQMGMASRKNSEPTVQWKLLRDLADERGVLTWQSRHADRKLKKRKQLLAEKLRAFFGLEGDPFELTANRKGWRARFVISPDRDPEDG